MHDPAHDMAYSWGMSGLKSEAIFAQTIFTIAFTFLAVPHSYAQNYGQSAPRFQTTADAADVVTPVGGKGVIGLGFSAETMYPVSKTFSGQKVNGGSFEDMRFQVPVGFAVEGSYGFTRQIEGALSFGYDNFKTQEFVSQNASTKTYEVAKYQLFPVMAIARYRWPKRGWSPEVEAALGAAFGSIDVRETTLSSVEQKLSGPFYRGHVSAGPAFSWAEGASLHFLVGYGFNRIGEHTYDLGAGKLVQQTATLHGVFTKAYLKFYF